MSQKLLLNHSSIVCSFAIDKPCDESHDIRFLMSRSQLYENLIILSHHHSLFSLSFSSGSENFTWLNYSSWFKSRVRIKFGCLLKASSSSRGGEQETLFNSPRWSSYLSHCSWNERTYNTWNRTSHQSDKIVGDMMFLIPCFLNFL